MNVTTGLTARLALDGYSRTIGDFTLCEAPQTSLVTLAFHQADRTAVAQAMKDSCRLDWPPIGSSSLSATGEQPAMRLMALQRDQYWLTWQGESPAAERQVRSWLGSTRARLTDQSDGWALVTLSGPDVLAVLERLCPLDLNESGFPIDSIARTVMEHLGTIVVREDQHRFGVFTARSSAASFRHAVENAAMHVWNEGR